jgi:hypothetical protein
MVSDRLTLMSMLLQGLPPQMITVFGWMMGGCVGVDRLESADTYRTPPPSCTGSLTYVRVTKVISSPTPSPLPANVGTFVFGLLSLSGLVFEVSQVVSLAGHHTDTKVVLYLGPK